VSLALGVPALTHALETERKFAGNLLEVRQFPLGPHFLAVAVVLAGGALELVVRPGVRV
jgi:hypothetical protein